jgi:thioredoxin 1
VIAKINIDENTATAAKFGVQSIPTLLLFKGGEVVKQYVGVQRKDELVGAIQAIV